ncbi:hypothetical protein [Spirosoma harenae]
MRKLMFGLTRVRLWSGIAMLTMSLGMGACHQMDVAPTSTTSSDSTAVRTHGDDDPPEKPGKPGGN